jgi:cyanophycin synthetase
VSQAPAPGREGLQALRIHAYVGYVRGLRQPSLRIQLGGLSDKLSERLGQIWAQEADWIIATGQPGLDARWHAMPNLPNGLEKVGLWLLHWTLALQRGSGLPVFEPGRLTRSGPTPGPTTPVTLWITLAPGQTGAGRAAFNAALQGVNAALLSDAPAPSDLLRQLQALVQRLQSATPKGANTPRLLRAAFEGNIPVWPLGREVYQYGYGCHARWLDSTFTDASAQIATRMARDKSWAALRLRQAGIPVPAHQPVATADAAVQAARQLGFPVVVKPADLDGGKGVAAGLQTEQEVRDAFERATQYSKHILLEKHVAGRDYRLTLLNGELLWAVERIPGGVTGDGRQTIAELVDQVNADPRRGTGAHAPLKRLLLDEDAHNLLASAGWTGHSVAPAGQFVALRRIANVATGGMPVAVNHRVHPDNAQLAVRAAQALRLDLAGVDLLIPDISRSWHESGAAVCEVNAQPQLGATTGPHLYGEVLKKLLPQGGRIPIALVLGAAPSSRLTEQLAHGLAAAGRRVAWSDERGVALGNQWLTVARTGSFAAGLMLLGQQNVEALVLGVNDDDLAAKGLPFDRFDWLVLAGRHLADESGATATAVALDDTLRWALAACTGLVLSLTGSGFDAADYTGHTPARLISPPKRPDEAIALMITPAPACGTAVAAPPGASS